MFNPNGLWIPETQNQQLPQTSTTTNYPPTYSTLESNANNGYYPPGGTSVSYEPFPAYPQANTQDNAWYGQESVTANSGNISNQWSPSLQKLNMLYQQEIQQPQYPQQGTNQQYSLHNQQYEPPPPQHPNVNVQQYQQQQQQPQQYQQKQHQHQHQNQNQHQQKYDSYKKSYQQNQQQQSQNYSQAQSNYSHSQNKTSSRSYDYSDTPSPNPQTDSQDYSQQKFRQNTSSNQQQQYQRRIPAQHSFNPPNIVLDKDQPTDKKSLIARISRIGTNFEDNNEIQEFLEDVYNLSQNQRNELMRELRVDQNLLDLALGWKNTKDLIVQNSSSRLFSPELSTILGLPPHTDGTAMLGSQPDQQTKRYLQQNNKKLFYEYINAFPDASLVDPRSEENLPKVLMVAEKPSVARFVAEFLSNGRMRTRRSVAKMCAVHEFFSSFNGRKAKIRVTSVVGHLFGLDFEDNKRKDEALLFDSRTVKKVEESTQKCHIVEHLRAEAEGCDYLCLWLDCDREGENICFEIISVVREQIPNSENIYRAKFSAITASEICNAFQRLVRPNMNESIAVDARQELDLKIGVAFTRFLTRRFRDMAQKKFDPELRLISYGPCQSPTLWFCVERYDQIAAFVPEPWWRMEVTVKLGHSDVVLKWSKDKTFDENEVNNAYQSCRRCQYAKVVNVTTKQVVLPRPSGMNTVQLLKTCSTGLGLGPGKAMKVAENLYTAGYISYPRTETSQYPASYDLTSVAEEHAQHPSWGKTVSFILRSNGGRIPCPSEGRDIGDHPPITPTKSAVKEDFVKNSDWRVYETVARHFFASLMPNCVYDETVYTIAVGQETFEYTTHYCKERGFTFIQPWRYRDLNLNDEEALGGPVPRLNIGQQLPVIRNYVDTQYTLPPSFLKESELIALMDQHGIGTDASIPQHIQNICERKYVSIPGAEAKFWKGGKSKQGPKGEEAKIQRLMVPTELGCSLIHAFRQIDEDLVRPAIRAHMEREVLAIANGQRDKDNVVGQMLSQFKHKFEGFRHQIGVMEELFTGDYVFDPMSYFIESIQQNNQNNKSQGGGGRGYKGGRGGGGGRGNRGRSGGRQYGRY